jgi:hypothetical protein
MNAARERSTLYAKPVFAPRAPEALRTTQRPSRPAIAPPGAFSGLLARKTGAARPANRRFSLCFQGSGTATWGTSTLGMAAGHHP